eukprot:GAHX01000494.1.p1 GENE.GAHX01000494.1~~GAHX01000494.1.p1  ORF type:complete len:751 (+),score=171.72 GAHX01000494.1:46-2298(+)
MFKVSGLSSNDKSYSNSAFIHPSHWAMFNNSNMHETQVCAINDITMNLKTDPDQEENKLGLNKLQRIFLEVSIDENIDVRPLNSKEIAFNNIPLVLVSIEVECLSKAHIDVEVAEFEKIFFNRFSKDLIVKNAPLIIDYKGNLIVYKAVNLKSPAAKKKDEKRNSVDGKDLLEERVFGILSAKTELNFKSAPPSPGKGTIKIKQDENKRRDIFGTELTFEQLGIGGLNRELGAIIRRAFVSRTFSAETIEKLGLQHVKGLLLYGPPGTGKTLIARQIGKMLKCKSLSVVNGPEILNKYVGASEENVRQLFIEAEEDFQTNGENAELHIIIFDEIDAICKQRGTVGGGTGVNDTVVNQLLSKMDGINALNNILIIGMTNRKDMIDSALLRPGRFEVHIEIGLPDEEGRLSIFNIHTKRLRENKLLDKDVSIEALAKRTKNYSGAEIQGVVKCAISFASFETMEMPVAGVKKNTKDSKSKPDQINVTMKHLVASLDEVKPSFGAETNFISSVLKNGFIFYSDHFKQLYQNNLDMLNQIKNNSKNSKLSMLLEGDRAVGTTSFACKLALDAGFEFTKLVTSEDFVGMSESGVAYKIRQIFEDSYKSPKSLIILDQIEVLLSYVPIGPRFLTNVLQSLNVLVKKYPPVIEDKEPRRLVIIATTAKIDVITQLGLKENFDVCQFIPSIKTKEDCESILKNFDEQINDEELTAIVNGFENTSIGIKKLLMLFDMAKDEDGRVNYEEIVHRRLNMNI